MMDMDLDNPKNPQELAIALTIPTTLPFKIAQRREAANLLEVLLTKWQEQRENKEIWNKKQADRAEFFEGLIKKAKQDEADNETVMEQQRDDTRACVERIIQQQAEQVQKLIQGINADIKVHEKTIEKLDEDIKVMDKEMFDLGKNIQARDAVEKEVLGKKIMSSEVVIMDGDKVMPPEEAKEKLAAIPEVMPTHEVLSKPDVAKALVTYAEENNMTKEQMAEDREHKKEVFTELLVCSGLVRKKDQSEEMDPKMMLKCLRDQKQAKGKSINVHIAEGAKKNFKENVKDTTAMMGVMKKRYQLSNELEGEKQTVASLKEAVNVLEKPVAEKVLPEKTILFLNNEMDKLTANQKFKL